MEKRKLISKTENIVIGSDSQKLIRIIDSSLYLKHLIPELVVNNTDDPVRFNLNVGSPCLSSQGIQAPFELISEGQICHLIYYIMQGELLRNNIYVVHGASFCKNDQATLILGPSKSGKSTIIFELGLKKNLLVYGDDAIRIQDHNSLFVTGGNTHLGLSPYHSQEKNYIDSIDLGIHALTSAKLTKVVFLEQDLLGTNPTRRISSETGNIRFYESISREMRSAGYCLMEADLALPPLDLGNYSNLFLKELKRSKIDFFVVTGNLEKMISDTLAL